MALEWSLNLIKPDGISRGLIGQIITRFEQKNLRLVGLKILWPSRELIEQAYSDKSDKPYFDKMVDYLTSGPIIAMVWEGENAIIATRQIIGKKDPLNSAPGTIRGDFANSMPQVLVHGARDPEECETQLKLFFGEENRDLLIYDTLLGIEDTFSENDAEPADEDAVGNEE